MLRLLAVAAVLAAIPVPAALAAPPSVTVAATPAVGAAPLTTTLTATGDAAAYRWELPGGATATGPSVTTTLAAGRWTATAIGTSATGEETRATVTVTAVALSLRAPPAVLTGQRAYLTGLVTPALVGSRLTVARTGRVTAHGTVRPGGAFRIAIKPQTPAAYTVALGTVVSRPVSVAIEPVVDLALGGAPVVGGDAAARATVSPAGAGTLKLRVYRAGQFVTGRGGRAAVRVPLDTRRAGAYRVVATLEPAPGYEGRTKLLDAVIRVPTLTLGSRGPAVLDLARRLSAQGYALEQVDDVFSADDADAVLAFQKVNGLPRTSVPDVRFWDVLVHSQRPEPHFGGADHIEVDKTRQVLFFVRGGQVVLISHVSTGATGNTPVGTWHVYRKVVGWDWVLWYPNYFIRGFAIHGYPDVPAYPASHGCVRVPMWLAPRLFSMIPYGETVEIY